MTSDDGDMHAERNIQCARAHVLLEPYLDGELSAMRLSQLESHLDACADCRVELESARSIQQGLRTLPHRSCPEDVIENVLARVESDSRRSVWSRTRDLLSASMASPTPRAWWRPAVASAAVAVMIVVISLLARQPQYNGYGAEELARAEREARWALLYVAQLTNRAGDAAMGSVIGNVMGEVIGERVVRPVTDAVTKPLGEEKRP
jgi:anti-sigma factor RsiW